MKAGQSVLDDFDPIVKVKRQLEQVFQKYQCKGVRAAVVLSELDLKSISDSIKQRKSMYPPEAMLKLQIYRSIRSLNTYRKLVQAIKRSPRDLARLGFEKLPSKRNLNYFEKRLKPLQRQQLQFIIGKIHVIATQNRSPIEDIQLVQRALNKAKYRKEQVKRLSNQSLLVLKKMVYGYFPQIVKRNARFTLSDIIDFLLFVGERRKYVNGSCDAYREKGIESEWIDADTIFYHLKKFDDEKDITILVEAIIDALLFFAKKNYRLLQKRKYCIAIDEHDIPWLGKTSQPNALGGKPKGNAKYFFKFLVAEISVFKRRNSPQ